MFEWTFEQTENSQTENSQVNYWEKLAYTHETNNFAINYLSLYNWSMMTLWKKIAYPLSHNRN